MDCGKQTFSFVDALFVSLIICLFKFILNSRLQVFIYCKQTSAFSQTSAKVLDKVSVRDTALIDECSRTCTSSSYYRHIHKSLIYMLWNNFTLFQISHLSQKKNYYKMLFLMKTKLIWTPDHFLCEVFDYKLSGLFGRENCHYFRWLVDREKTSIYWDCACFILVLVWKPQARIFSVAWGPILLPLSFDTYLAIWWCGGFWWYFFNRWVTGFSWNV